jgi:hypothetical protein
MLAAMDTGSASDSLVDISGELDFRYAASIPARMDFASLDYGGEFQSNEEAMIAVAQALDLQRGYRCEICYGFPPEREPMRTCSNCAAVACHAWYEAGMNAAFAQSAGHSRRHGCALTRPRHLLVSTPSLTACEASRAG